MRLYQGNIAQQEATISFVIVRDCLQALWEISHKGRLYAARIKPKMVEPSFEFKVT